MFKPSILFFAAHHYGYCYGRDSLDAGHWLSPLVNIYAAAVLLSELKRQT